MSSQNPIQAANPHHSAIVKASAGVGKTYLLVTRLIRLLLLDVRPDAILAITFTRKAAAEMQSRLFDRLYMLATVDEAELIAELNNIGVDTSPMMLQKSRGLYEHMMRNDSQVKTNTFHAFCQEILRKFPLESDVPPGFELLDDEPSYIAAAWDALYEEATLQPESDVAKALERLYDLANGLANTQSCLNSFVNQRSDWWAYTSDHQDNAKNAATYASEKLLDDLDIDLEATPYADFFTQSRKNEINRIAQLLALHDTATNLKYVDQLHQVTMSNDFPDILNENSLSENEYADWIKILSATLFKTDGEIRFEKKVKARSKKMTEAGEDEFIELCLSICKRINTAKEVARKQHNYYLNDAWYLAGEALLNHFQQLKVQQRLLDFTDLEWRTFNLLNNSENATWVQYKLDQRIEHLLVDEFQDTNPTQWRLLLPIMQEFATDTDRLRSVFLVGDEKQSIYSFRRADPKLFSTASDWLHENLEAKSFPMDKSRRSASPVMNLLNSVFMSDDFKQTLPGFHTHSTFLNDATGSVNLLPLIEAEEKTEEPIYFRNSITTPLPQEDDAYYREGQQIAQSIKELMQSEYFVEGDDEIKSINYKDIMLLIRSRKHLSSYETALREAGIPYISNNKGTLFECQEIQDLIALLEVLYTPYNSLSLATVLRSPIFLCSNASLLMLAEKTIESKSDNWFDVLLESAGYNSDGEVINLDGGENESERASEKKNKDWPSDLNHAAQNLSHWKNNIGQLPIHDMLDKIFYESNIFERYHKSVPAHFRSRVKSNLTQFLSLALDIDSGRYPSLGRFLAKLHSLIQNDASPDETTDASSTGTVRILTIHASKGLEAPVVFLADAADNKKEKSHSYNTLVDWPEEDEKPSTFLICPKKENQINVITDLLAQQKEKSTIEDANLLYVALTRARQYLYISGCSKVSTGTNTAKATKESKNKLGWYGLIQKHWPDQD
ncbi:MAG: UvrD-helicase domain-containing protein, partial [Gammaproteobacteria bacterium]|nr:UvrD-helicase domain-containing protein [Gammaproteobacteria bacterium]